MDTGYISKTDITGARGRLGADGDGEATARASLLRVGRHPDPGPEHASVSDRIAHYADATGRMHDTPQRRHLSLVDGIVAGEGDGPLDPDPIRAGTIAMSDSGRASYSTSQSTGLR